MKVYVKLDYVTSIIKTYKRTYWRLYDGNSKLLLDTIDNEYSVDDSIELLTNAVTNFTGQYCLCKIYDKKPTKNNAVDGQTKVYEYLISLDENKAAANQNNNSAPGNSFIYEMFGKLQELNIQMVKQQADFDKKEMERKIDELKKEKNESNAGLDGITKTIERMYFAYTQKNKPGTTTATEAIVMEPAQPKQVVKGIFGNDDDKQKFISLIKRWTTADKNYLEALEIVVRFAEQQPEQYKFYIQTLKNN